MVIKNLILTVIYIEKKKAWNLINSKLEQNSLIRYL